MNETIVSSEIAQGLADVARGFYTRGWVMGTSGNFSAVVSRSPLVIAISQSGADKGLLTSEQILLVDEDCKILKGSGKPSDETLLHFAVAQERGAGAVLHTHSVWSTLAADAQREHVEIEGYEMLKGLNGIRTHNHTEKLPILDNHQDMTILAEKVKACLKKYEGAHAFLLRRHGLYTWGRDLAEARRHVEILEFLLEVIGRRPTLNTM